MNQGEAQPLTHAWHITGSSHGRSMGLIIDHITKNSEPKTQCLQCIRSTSSMGGQPDELGGHEICLPSRHQALYIRSTSWVP